MSYLHKLKQQAQALKNREQAHAQEQQRRDTFYQEHINPAMLKIGKFLAELTDNLNYVQPEVKVDYEILRDQWLQGLRHSKYVNYMDSSEQCKATSLLIECEGPRQIEFWINDSKESEKMTEFLFNRKVQFKQNKIHHMGQLRSQFEIHPKMTIRFDFNADIARSKIVLRITNFDKLGSEIHLLDPAQINDKFIEELTEFVVRERKEFLKVEVDTSLKERFQAMVQQEQQRQAEELAAMEASQREQQGQQRANSGIMKGILRFRGT